LKISVLSVVAVTGVAIVVAVPADAALPAGATVTVTPSMDLPDSSTTSVTVDGESLYPNATVQIQQCETKPGASLCEGQYDGSTDGNGDINEDIPVSYQLPNSQTCDSEPGSTATTCTVQIVYTRGNGGVAASAPLTFAGHDGGPATIAFDQDGQPVNTQVNKTMKEPDGSAAHVLVDVENADGSIDSGFTGAVTISFTQPNNAEFVTGKPPVHTSSLTVNAVNGVADFSPIVIDTVGFGDTLVADTAGLDESAPSASFDVGSASALCPAGKSCTVRTKSSDGQVAIVKALGGSGTPGTVVTASFGGNVSPLHGCSTPAAGILTFNGNRVKVIKLKIPTTSYIGTICWGQPTPFIDQTGSETTYFSSENQDYEGVLGFCSATIPTPCINKITVKAASETVMVTGGSDDPHMSH